MADENHVEPQQVTTEPQQVTKEPQQVTQVMKEPQGEAAQVQRVTTKNPKKVEAGKRLAESNRKKREAKKQSKLEASGVNQYYGIGAVLALGVIGGLGYYIYQSKKGEQPQRNNPKPHPQMEPQTNSGDLRQGSSNNSVTNFVQGFPYVFQREEQPSFEGLLLVVLVILRRRFPTRF